MSKIFELFGYRLDDQSKEARDCREKAWCPFMDAMCDGGGNRNQSRLDVKNIDKLRRYFRGASEVHAGICSLSVRPGEPWIVCPRRLLALRAEGLGREQSHVRAEVMRRAGLPQGHSYRVWSEVKVQEKAMGEGEDKSFDYTFDYVVAGSASIRLSDAARMVSMREPLVRKVAEAAGYTMALRTGEMWIEDWPAHPLVIIEIMTSSTSGGNKHRRTQVGMAVEDALLGLEHNGPGINYRQVWARMASQLIVKSQVAIAWGGATFWVIQDKLAEYISATTALDLAKYVGERAGEVNILSFGYGDVSKVCGLQGLESGNFYSGPISRDHENGGFVDIVKSAGAPELAGLWRVLMQKRSCGSLAH